MQQTQHTCQVLSHPALSPAYIFIVRRMARDAGCQYVTREQRRRASTPAPGPFGGDAA